MAVAVFCLSCASVTRQGRSDTVEPLTKLKKLYLDTELSRDGKPQAVIYHPASAEYAEAAEELSRRLQGKCGCGLPLKCDDAQRTWRTETQNIIVLGHFGNSLLLRWLHSRSFVAPHSGSGVTPLSLRRRIRTIHDPWGQGRNVVMLGGVDVANVKANFPRLLELLQTPAPGAAVLPRTLDPKPALSDSLKARIDDYHKNLHKMPMNYPAYRAGWVCKHYPSLGHEEFIPLYRDSIRRLAETKSYVHLYLFRESRCWDVIEESPVLTDSDRLMVTNFFRNSVADEKEGIGNLRRIMRRKRLIQGNHQSQTACGIMVVADYLRRYYPSELHEKWYREALAFFEPYRTRGSYVGDDEGMQGASISNIMNAVYQITDDPASHPFLRSTLERLMPNYNNFGRWPAYGDQRTSYKAARGWYELGARIYRSPEYLWMTHFIRSAGPDARPKIPTELAGPSWSPLDFVARQPERFVGLQWAEPDDTLFSLARPKWVKEHQVTMPECFGRAAFRAGIDPQDDYLLLDGVHLNHAYDDQNGILEYSTLGRTFLVSLDYCYGTPDSAHNIVSVSVDGMADVYPALLAVRRLWADLPSFAATRTVLLPDGRADWQRFYHPSADWERSILWLKNRFFVVFDRVIARRDAMHSAVCFWRMVGERHDHADGVEMRQRAGKDEVRFRLAVNGVDRFVLGKEDDPQAAYVFSRYGKQAPPLDTVPPVIHMLKAHKARRLEKGESFTMSACFWASSPKRPQEVTCKPIAPSAVRVEVDGQPMLAARGPVSLNGLNVDAQLSLIGADRVCIVAGRKLTVAGRAVLTAETPVSLEWNLASGQCVAVAQRATSISLAGHTLSLPQGRSTHQAKRDDLPKALAAALRSLPESAPVKPTKHLPPAAKRLDVVAQRKGKSEVTCLWAGRLGQAGDVALVGRQDGTVDALAGDGLKPLWQYRCERVVNSIDTGDLSGDAAPEIAVGSDDHHLHALKRDGKLLWKWKPPFDELKARIAYCQWLWPEPFVKKVVVHDLNRDGKADVVAGTGMNTFGVDGQGKQLWAFRGSKGHCPSMQAIVFADVNSDGVEEPVGGASDMWYVSCMWPIGPKGEQMKIGPKADGKYYASDGWCSGVKVALAEDVLGKAKKALIYGTRRGGVWCYPDASNWAVKWYRRFGDKVEHLATLHHKDGTKLIAAAGGDTKWVTAFDPAGNRLWAVYFDAAVAAMAPNAAQTRLYVGCDDGAVYELDAAGRVLRSAHLAGRPKAIASWPGGGVTVGIEEGSVYLVR